MAEKTPAITRYNNKTYRIEDIDWERNLKHTFDKTWKTGETKTLSHVQQEIYQKTIPDPTLPEEDESRKASQLYI